MSDEMLRLLATLQQSTSASFFRSDALRPLHILVGMLVTATAVLVYAKAPEPFLYGAGGLTGLAVLVELGAIVYCLVKDPDLLRSDKVRMTRMAIEARMLGDSSTGLFQAEIEPRPGAQIINATPQLAPPAKSGRGRRRARAADVEDEL